MPARPRHRTRALFALAIVAAACSGQGDGVDAPSASPAGERSTGASTPAANGPIAEILRFSAPSLDGGTIEGKDYSRRDVAFWFWAPW